MTRLILLHENTTFTSCPVIKRHFLIVAPRPEMQLRELKAITDSTRRFEKSLFQGQTTRCEQVYVECFSGASFLDE